MSRNASTQTSSTPIPPHPTPYPSHTPRHAPFRLPAVLVATRSEGCHRLHISSGGHAVHRGWNYTRYYHQPALHTVPNDNRVSCSVRGHARLRCRSNMPGRGDTANVCAQLTRAHCPLAGSCWSAFWGRCVHRAVVVVGTALRFATCPSNRLGTRCTISAISDMDTSG